MRRIILPFIGILLTIGCKSNSASTENRTKADTTNPASYEIDPMSSEEKTRYAKLLSDFFDSSLLLKNNRFNGSVLVAKGGNILYERYAGYKNPNIKADTVNEHTAFHLASTSKPFTGIAVLRLVQEHKIGLADPLTKYFPQFPYTDVTVQDLLSHRSGLPEYIYVMADKTKWDPNKMVTNNDMLQFLIEQHPQPNFRPNTRFSYCNTNFALLALVVEKVTGKKFPAYIKETIFDPLQMSDTFIFTPGDSSRVLMSYKPSGAVWENDIFEQTYGDKNVYSTPRDMFKWDRALYNPHFIRPSLLDSAYQPHSNEKPSMHNYGLGWRMLNLRNGKKVIYHNGKWHGFTPAFARLIEEKAVIIILGNKINDNMYKSARDAYSFFGDYKQVSDPGGDPEAAPAAAAAPAPKAPQKTAARGAGAAKVKKPVKKQATAKKGKTVKKSTASPKTTGSKTRKKRS